MTLLAIVFIALLNLVIRFVSAWVRLIGRIIRWGLKAVRS
jgi:hypothetical protein